MAKIKWGKSALSISLRLSAFSNEETEAPRPYLIQEHPSKQEGAPESQGLLSRLLPLPGTDLIALTL